MNVLDLMKSRHSYRGLYKNEPVPRKDLMNIMQAGLAAPSGCNKQTTSLIAVDDPLILDQIKAVIDPPVAETAPAMICVLTQRIIAYRDRCFNVHDYSAAIENMLLEIEALGYASCWYEGHITDVDRIGDKIARILSVPEDYELICILPVGKPLEEPIAAKKKMLTDRAWFNGFGQKPHKERSCGAVIYTTQDGERKFVMIRAAKGICGFPKGHMEPGETEEQTALREIREETGLEVTLHPRFRTFDEYPLPGRPGRPDFLKEVIYFLAEFEGQELKPVDQNEIADICLMTYEQAMQALPFEGARRVLMEANQYIERHQ